MIELQNRILEQAEVKGNVLKVGRFLNQLVDTQLMNRIGEEFARLFREQKPDKVLTLESSGIAPALMTALHLQIPLATARKHAALNLGKDVLSTEVYSFTKQTTYNVLLEGFAIQEGERVLLIDDFLARGHAVLGLVDLVEQAKAQVVGVGIVIEKGFEPGAKVVQGLGVPLHSLAVIDSLEDEKIRFRPSANEPAESNGI